MHVLKPPTQFVHEELDGPIIFLGGSIEMGKAVDWQKTVETSLADLEGTILNPRRDNWDASLPQDPTPGTVFHEQVTWEMYSQEVADVIIYNFEPGTMSPITLLELGLYSVAGFAEVFVCCPPTFWRHGNVKMVCDRYNIQFFEDLPALLDRVRKFVVFRQESM